MDGGDCINFNLFYPACKEVKDFEKIDSARIGDGICDRHPYNAAECLFDGGDCRIDASYCSSSKKGTLGDGICDEELNVWECYFDRGDCLDSRSSSDVGDEPLLAGLFMCLSRLRPMKFERLDDAQLRKIEQLGLQQNRWKKLVLELAESLDFPIVASRVLCENNKLVH